MMKGKHLAVNARLCPVTAIKLDLEGEADE